MLEQNTPKSVVSSLIQLCNVDRAEQLTEFLQIVGTP